MLFASGLVFSYLTDEIYVQHSMLFWYGWWAYCQSAIKSRCRKSDSLWGNGVFVADLKVFCRSHRCWMKELDERCIIPCKLMNGERLTVLPHQQMKITSKLVSILFGGFLSSLAHSTLTHGTQFLNATCPKFVFNHYNEITIAMEMTLYDCSVILVWHS